MLPNKQTHTHTHTHTPTSVPRTCYQHVPLQELGDGKPELRHPPGVTVLGPRIYHLLCGSAAWEKPCVCRHSELRVCGLDRGSQVDLGR